VSLSVRSSRSIWRGSTANHRCSGSPSLPRARGLAGSRYANAQEPAISEYLKAFPRLGNANTSVTQPSAQQTSNPFSVLHELGGEDVGGAVKENGSGMA
jgi:hypothetical protein